MVAASARCSMGMVFVLATVPLPTGMACSVMRVAMSVARSSTSGWKARYWMMAL